MYVATNEHAQVSPDSFRRFQLRNREPFAVLAYSHDIYKHTV
jgi:hypothetical protein